MGKIRKGWLNIDLNVLPSSNGDFGQVARNIIVWTRISTIVPVSIITDDNLYV